LEDKKIGGAWLNMRNNDSYAFHASVNDDWNRFVVHFTPAIKVNTLNATCTSLGQVTIEQPGSASWNYSLNDQNNTVIYTGVVNSNNPQYLGVQSGSYTLQCTDANNYSFTQQIQVGGTIGISSVLSASKNNVLLGESVTFNAIANGATNYTWDFGDGTTITGNSAQTHTYLSAGVYTTIVTVTSASGCIATTSQVITVTNPNVTSNNDIRDFGVNIFSFENKVVVDFSKQKNVNATVQMYNILGQEIATEKWTSSTIYTREINNSETAYVMVRVTNSDGKWYTKKLLISNTR
jgi:PKD repeat protein